MSDWNVGDLAVCVDNSPKRASGPVNRRNLALLTVGASYVVSWVGIDPDAGGSLLLVGVPHDNKGGIIAGFRGDRFRRVVQDKHEACEAEFVTLLKRSRVRAGIVRDLIFTMGRVARG
jgi:hypothetical protein